MLLKGVIIMLLMTLFLPLSARADGESDAEVIKNLREKLDNSTGDEHFRLLNDLVSMTFGEPEEIKWLHRMHHDAIAVDNKTWIAKSISLMCRYFYNTGMVDSVAAWSKVLDEMPLESAVQLAYFDTKYYSCMSLLNIGEMEEAIQKAVALQSQATSLHSKDGEISCAEILAEIMIAMRQDDKALESYKSCYDLLTTLSPRRITYEYQILSQILDLQLYVGDMVETRVYLEKIKMLITSGQIKPSWGNMYYRSLKMNYLFEANYNIGIGNFARAEECVLLADRLGRIEEDFMYWLEYKAKVSLAEHRGDLGTQLAFLNAMEQLSYFGPAGQWHVFMSKAKVYSRLTDYPRASEYFNRAVDTLSADIAMNNSLEFSQFTKVCHEQYRVRMNQDYEVNTMRTTIAMLILGAVLLVMLVASVIVINLRRLKILKELRRAEAIIRVDSDKLVVRNEMLRATYDNIVSNGSMKMMFLTNMSHEIRTPLNSIVGFSSLLTELATNDDQRECVQIIRDNSMALSVMVNNFLELSRIDSGRVTLHNEDVAIADVVRDVASSEKAKFPDKDVQFVLEEADNLPTVWTDRSRISQVMSNLLSNAFKFTEQGYVKVKLAADSEWFTIIVEDTGCGVPKDKSESIFDRFEKCDSFVPGSGLGLPICSGLVKLMGGKIYVDTSYEDGLRMVVELAIRNS